MFPGYSFSYSEKEHVAFFSVTDKCNRINRFISAVMKIMNIMQAFLLSLMNMLLVDMHLMNLRRKLRKSLNKENEMISNVNRKNDGLLRSRYIQYSVFADQCFNTS